MDKLYLSAEINTSIDSQVYMENVAFDWLNVLRYSGKTFSTNWESYVINKEGILTVHCPIQKNAPSLSIKPGSIGCLGSLKNEERAERYWRELFINSRRASLSEAAHNRLIGSSFEAWSDYINRNWQPPEKGRRLAISIWSEDKVGQAQIGYFTGPIVKIS